MNPNISESDMVFFARYLTSSFSIDTFNLSLLQEVASVRTIKKSDFFVREGKVCEEVGLLTVGILRFYSTIDGNEKTHDFSFPDSFVTSYISLLQGTPSDLSIQALSDSRLIIIGRADLYALYDKSHKIERIGRLLAEQSFSVARTHLLSVLHDDAETRYKKLLERAPHFIQYIPLHYIASYLGISPETLSRIRKRISIS